MKGYKKNAGGKGCGSSGGVKPDVYPSGKGSSGAEPSEGGPAGGSNVDVKH